MKNKTTILLTFGVLLTGSAFAGEPKPAQAAEPASQIDKQPAQPTANANAKAAKDNKLEMDAEKKIAPKALADIKLPKNPTRKQCEAYLDELRKASVNRRNFSRSDLATKKLKELPAEHFHLLSTEMANRTSLCYFASYAMDDIDREELRGRLVKTIDKNPYNIAVILKYGWCQDVRPAIINYINNADESVEPVWFQAAVELGEPSLYPKLHEIAIQSSEPAAIIRMLEILPDYDLARTINAFWRQANDKTNRIKFGHANVSGVKYKAAAYGNVEALGMLVDELRNGRSYLINSYPYNFRRTSVLPLIDYRGSNKEIQAWYKANKDELVFDQSRKRFIARQQAQPQVPTAEASKKGKTNANAQKKTGIKAWDDIKLPKTPTREQCEAYLDELRDFFARGGKSLGAESITGKLYQIPAEHFSVLVTEMDKLSKLRGPADWAIRGTESEEFRASFVKFIENDPYNINIIIRHGWSTDVRAATIKQVKNNDGGPFSQAWFQAAVELYEPKLYPKLHEITTRSPDTAFAFIRMLKVLPDYDLAHTVDACWRRARDDESLNDISGPARGAASYGSVDALGFLIDELNTRSTSYMDYSSSYSALRLDVLRHIDYRGSNTEILAWYKANKDKLAFDRLRQRFIVPEDF